jgi:glycerol-3-phosphate cytidylyltransferase
MILTFDVRILGIEYADKDFSGRDECYDRGIFLVFNGRDHSFSSSSLRKRVVAAETEKVLMQK